MSTPAAVHVDNAAKLYRRSTPGDQFRTLKSALLDGTLTRGLAPENAIAALDGVSFSVSRGEAFGVIGSNGSGKSTLLKLLAGILQPTRGEVLVRGRVAALIELGAGFHPEISGRENVYINGAVLGLTRREIDHRYESIVEFSGLGDFMEEPVKNYSSGMYVRLGFAVAVHTDPDVLLVDEVLAVGDEAFAHRCLARIEEFVAAGKTLVLVSHSLSLVEENSERVLWLEKGKVRMVGEPRRVIDAYRQSVAEAEGEAHGAAKRRREAEEQAAGEPAEPGGVTRRWGSGRAEIVSARLCIAGEERYHLTSGEPFEIEIQAQTEERLTDFVFGVAIFTPRGEEVWGTNSDLAGLRPEAFVGVAKVTVAGPELRLGPGEYLLDVALHARDGAPYDYRKGMLRFSVIAEARGVGVYFPRHHWQIEGGASWRREPD